KSKAPTDNSSASGERSVGLRRAGQSNSAHLQQARRKVRGAGRSQADVAESEIYGDGFVRIDCPVGWRTIFRGQRGTCRRQGSQKIIVNNRSQGLASSESSVR